jgi:hypothetical protein
MRITRSVESIEEGDNIKPIANLRTVVYAELLDPTSQASIRKHSLHQLELLQRIHGRERELAVFFIELDEIYRMIC